MCDSPSAPDPYATADAQGKENRDSALFNTKLLRPTINSPMGNLTWTTDPNDPTKQTANFDLNFDFLKKYGQNTSYSTGSSGSSSNSQSSTSPTPIDEEMLNAYKNLLPALGQKLSTPTASTAPQANVAGVYNALRAEQPQMGAITAAQNTSALGADALAGSQVSRLQDMLGKDFNYDNVVAAPIANEETRRQVEDALYSRSTSRLDPTFSQRTNDQNSALAAQGITQGSQAYEREIDNLARERTDAYAAARNDAISNSTTEMKKLFDMGMDARQQGVSEANTLRTLPVQEALAAQQAATQASGRLNQTVGTQTQQMGTAGVTAASGMDSEMKRAQQQFEQGNYDRESLLKALQALRSGGQASLASSTTTSSGGSSNESGSSSYQLPNVFGAGNAAGSAGAAPIASLISQNYQGDVASSNATNAGMAQLGGSALMAAAMGLT